MDLKHTRCCRDLRPALMCWRSPRPDFSSQMSLTTVFLVFSMVRGLIFIDTVSKSFSMLALQNFIDLPKSQLPNGNFLDRPYIRTRKLKMSPFCSLHPSPSCCSHPRLHRYSHQRATPELHRPCSTWIRSKHSAHVNDDHIISRNVSLTRCTNTKRWFRCLQSLVGPKIRQSFEAFPHVACWFDVDSRAFIYGVGLQSAEKAFHLCAR